MVLEMFRAQFSWHVVATLCGTLLGQALGQDTWCGKVYNG